MRDSALALPLQRECVLMGEIGIPLFVGYCSSVAADFRALLTCSAVTSALVPLDQYDDNVVLVVPPCCHM